MGRRRQRGVGVLERGSLAKRPPTGVPWSNQQRTARASGSCPSVHPPTAAPAPEALSWPAREGAAAQPLPLAAGGPGIAAAGPRVAAGGPISTRRTRPLPVSAARDADLAVLTAGGQNISRPRPGAQPRDSPRATGTQQKGPCARSRPGPRRSVSHRRVSRVVFIVSH